MHSAAWAISAVQRLCLGALLLLPAAARPQEFTQRGFLETRLVLYPQTAANDSGRAIGEALLRYEPSLKLRPSLRISGAFDARADSHRQTERGGALDWGDRRLQRPAFSVRRLSAIYNAGPVTVEAGKQFIRWGKADILNPTDRFAPRDFLGVVDNDFLAVTGARLTYAAGSNTVDAVWVPLFTPSRVPLVNQRWTVLPEAARAFELRDRGARFPGGSQVGLRWNRLARGFEYSLSFYQGFNHLPLFDVQANLPRVDFQRFYPTLRMYGGDAAVPLRFITLKGEAAWFSTSTSQADEYVLYVIQVERQAGEWSFVAGYAGEHVTRARSTIDFAPDRGLARALVGRAGYTIDATRSLAFEAAARQNGEGVWLKAEYSQLLGQHLRATAAFTLIRGDPRDFLGQFRRNSHASLALRYSF